MYAVELYKKIRRAVMVDGKSGREVARFFGIHRQSVKKMCAYSVPPGYRRSKSAISPKLAPFVPIIDAILATDRAVHRKQRHTAVRIWERLREEHGITGGYAIVREYVNGVALIRQEMFVPLSHQPGHAQVDFGEADGYVGGKKLRYHYFCLDLPHSDAVFVKSCGSVRIPSTNLAEDLDPVLVDRSALARDLNAGGEIIKNIARSTRCLLRWLTAACSSSGTSSERLVLNTRKSEGMLTLGPSYVGSARRRQEP